MPRMPPTRPGKVVPMPIWDAARRGITYIYIYIYVLAWLGLAWLGLAWLGLVWFGLVGGQHQ